MTTPTGKPVCHCGSQKTFADCCQPLLQGKQQAPTAEALMRSRYSAFAMGNIDYLIDTLHPDKRQPQDALLLRTALDGCEWLGLEVRHSEAGRETDDKGSVEFVASYREGGQLGLLHERSRFVKEHGRWYYVDGDLYANDGTSLHKPGRNNPCWCGSGKKFKKCHGAP